MQVKTFGTTFGGLLVHAYPGFSGIIWYCRKFGDYAVWSAPRADRNAESVPKQFHAIAARAGREPCGTSLVVVRLLSQPQTDVFFLRKIDAAANHVAFSCLFVFRIRMARLTVRNVRSWGEA